MDRILPSLTVDLARFVASKRYEDLPDDVRTQAKRCLVDFLGVALAGSRQDLTPKLLEAVQEMGGVPEASLIGYAERTSRFWAAAINGSIGHTLELDDGHIVAHTHPGVTTIPAALAAAEKQRASGRDLITAVVLGYEVNLRIGDGVTPEAQYERGFHAASAVGSLGAAAAVSHLYQFEIDRLVGALGNCCLGPISPLEPFRTGTAIKDLYGGWPAAMGLWAAELARRGIVGPESFLEGPRGMLNCLSRSWNAAEILRGLGEDWLIMGVYTKRHAACSLAHTAIDATLALVPRLSRPVSDIEEIRVRTHIFANELDDPSPETPQGAKFSIPFVVACAIIHDRVGIDEFSSAVIHDPDIRELARKVTVVLDSEYTKMHSEREDRRPCTVAIRYRDGTIFEETRAIARGWPEDPLSAEEFREKFESLAARATSTAQAESIWNTVWNLEGVDDVSKLVALLQPEAAVTSSAR